MPSSCARALAVALALAVPGLLACASSGTQDEESASRGLRRVTKTGVMRVGMSGEQPPLTMTTRSGKMIGLDVALANVLAGAMGVEVEFVRLPFGELLDALEAGQLEIVMSGMTITPARSRRATFIGPYFTSGKTLCTRSEELAAVELAKDLNRPTKKLSALAGSTSEKFVQEMLPRATLLVSASLDDAIRRAIDGEADALMADRETCHFARLRHPDARLLLGRTTFTIEPMGIAVQRDDPRFARMIETFLASLEKTGAIQRARDFWFRDDSWVKDLQ
ncbi:MAG: transporter substrate-binding domain-containing protein [Myxococcota bacterium]|nr:transporter substrate-binding domain-containing protein [Myxococcota bacterium]